MTARVQIAAAFFVATLGWANAAAGDWPMQRHDAARTGQATGTGNVANPAIYFKSYLGGSLGGLSLLPLDVDGDQTPELVYLSGGRVVAKRSNDSLVWQTPPRGYGQLTAATDLDGDGFNDLVVQTSGGLVVLEASTGAVKWTQPEQQMGTLGRAVIGDLDGDGLDDLLTQECGCCGVNSGNTGYAVSFAKGMSNPQDLWELPHAPCGGYGSLGLVDIDADGDFEVINASEQSLHLLDGKTGQIIASSPPLGSWTQANVCRGHDIDQEPGDELLCILNRSTLPAKNQRKVTVLKRAGSSLVPLWTKLIAPDDGGDVQYIDPFIDLNADGALEVVVSSKDAQDIWTTHVFEASTGKAWSSLSGERVVGIASIDKAGHSMVLTRDAKGLIAHAFESSGLVERWRIDDRIPMAESNRKRLSKTGAHAQTVTLDLDGDGIDELLTRTVTGAPLLTAYKATSQKPEVLAVYVIPTDIDVISTWSLPAIDTGSPQLGVARNDGRLILLDAKFLPTPIGLADPGIRIGGYYAAGGWGDLRRTPVVARLGSGPAESIVVSDSRSTLLRLDAAEASIASPPRRRWQRSKTLNASIVDNLDGNQPGVVSFSLQQPVSNPPEYRLSAMRSDGSLLFDEPVGGLPLRDIVAGNINNDATPDLLFHWGDPKNTLLRTRAVDGQSGQPIWESKPMEPNCGRQPAGLSAIDFTGDGITDVLHHAASQPHVIDGSTGNVTLSGLYVGGCYAMATVFSTDGGSEEQFILHGSNYGPTMLESDLETLRFSTPYGGLHYPYGAIAQCASGPVLVIGSWANRATLNVVGLSGSAAGQMNGTVLAGGKAYGTQAEAEMAGEPLGQLSSASVHSNLDGSQTPTAVVGSADGWLYGFDPCSGTLRFSMNFKAAVGEAVFGDTDGDGNDEIIVTAADGYLYGLKHENIEKPSEVIDTFPEQGLTDDIDARPNTGSLSASWSAVPNASGYQVAVVDDAGEFASSPSWTDVGKQTKHTFANLTLKTNGRYQIAVRAMNDEQKPSVDAMSDGVTVYNESETAVSATVGVGGGTPSNLNGGAGGEDPGYNTRRVTIDSGCGCRLDGAQGSSKAPWQLSALAAACLLMTRRRRR